jgi:hypothetical protein
MIRGIASLLNIGPFDRRQIKLPASRTDRRLRSLEAPPAKLEMFDDRLSMPVPAPPASSAAR